MAKKRRRPRGHHPTAAGNRPQQPRPAEAAARRGATRGRAAESGRSGSSKVLGLRLPLAVQILVFVLAAVAFGWIVAARGGPTTNDAETQIVPATALSNGDIHGVFSSKLGSATLPGYSLLTAPLVGALRPAVGAPDWCKPAAYGCLNTSLESFVPKSASAFRPVWYRSQALLAFLAWAVLELGVIAVARASGRGGTVLEALGVLMVAATPAVADALVEFFHPEDALATGFVALGVAAALRKRWVLTGLAFGCGFVSVQFALLAFIPVLVAGRGLRARRSMLITFVAVVAAVTVPFLAVDPGDTLHSLAAHGISSSASGLSRTVLSSATAYSTTTLYAVARFGPFVIVALVCWLAWYKKRDSLLEPRVLLGTVAACLASRLVLEQTVFRYYFVAAAVMLVCLDVAARRWPIWSAGWIGLTTAWWYNTLNLSGSQLTASLTPIVLLALSLAAIGIGIQPLFADDIAAIARRRRSRPRRAYAGRF